MPSTRTPKDYCQLYRGLDREYGTSEDSPLHHDNRCPVNHSPVPAEYRPWVSYMVKAWDIVGYAYQADTYCPSCIIGAMPTGEGQLFDGWDLGPNVHTSAEDFLQPIAVAFGIDRATADTDEFPAIITAGEGTSDHCIVCHEEL